LLQIRWRDAYRWSRQSRFNRICVKLRIWIERGSSLMLNERLNSDGQQFHQYQQKVQPHITSNH
jgi:hypothetical protein